jgi:hypothetical protein
VVWALHFPSKPENLRTDNRVATLEAAKVEFEASWRQWLAWVKLGRGAVTRLELRGRVAIAFMAAALWIMLLIAAWEYLHLCSDPPRKA